MRVSLICNLHRRRPLAANGLRLRARVLAVVLAFCASPAAAQKASDTADPAVWRDSAIGMEEVVLPGFEPIVSEHLALGLGAARSYNWSEDSLLPTRLTHAGVDVVSSMRVQAKVDGRTHVLTSSTAPTVELHGGHHAIVRAEGDAGDGLRIAVETRVEYDGLAMVSLKLIPTQALRVERLEVRCRIDAPAHARALRFEASTVRKRKKQFVYPVEYSGPFLNALGIAGGSHSFWWFADDGEGRIAGKGPAMTVTRVDADSVEMTDVLIGEPATIENERTIRLNYLVTPVRPGTAWRRDRIALNTTRDEGRYGNMHLWWVDAFAHVALPYTSLPPGAAERLPRDDVRVYKGAAEAKRKVARAKLSGVNAIPYFSAHALSALDPVLARYGGAWKVTPAFVVPNSSDGPFTSELKRPFLSHRSGDYTNYLLYRFEALIDEIGFAGLYFDQGGVINSESPAHAWRDRSGRSRQATDILGMRSFFKRLATLFHDKGLPGYIFVHNSASPIVPAYTFVTGMVQGEEYRQRINVPDYVGHIDLAELRTAYAPGQYGVPTYWLSTLWSHHMRPKAYRTTRAWVETAEYAKALTGYQGLALLHDVPIWSLAPLKLRAPVYDRLDRFGIASAEFKGYWDSMLETADEGTLVSYYRHAEADRILVIVMNMKPNTRTFEVRHVDKAFECERAPDIEVVSVFSAKDVRVDGGRLEGTIEGNGFALVDIGLAGKGSGACRG